MNNYGTTVTMPIDTVVPKQLLRQYHSCGTIVIIAMERVLQQAWNNCSNRAISFLL